MDKKEFLETYLSLFISHTELINDQNNKYVILDVRNAPSEVKKMQIKGAIPCPAKDIASHLNTFDHDKTYVVYDWNSGTILAKTALMQLLDAGFNAYELAGDFEGWQGMNLPLEKAY